MVVLLSERRGWMLEGIEWEVNNTTPTGRRRTTLEIIVKPLQLLAEQK